MPDGQSHGFGNSSGPSQLHMNGRATTVNINMSGFGETRVYPRKLRTPQREETYIDK